jgi:hypothetical protein
LARLPGCGVEDAASAALRAHPGGGGLAAEEGAGRVDAQDAIPVLEGELLEPADRDDAGVVDEHVDALGRAAQVRHVGGLGDVGLHADAAELLGGRVDRLAEVGEHHARALGGEAGGDALADPAAGAGHHDRLAVKAS